MRAWIFYVFGVCLVTIDCAWAASPTTKPNSVVVYTAETARNSPVVPSPAPSSQHAIGPTTKNDNIGFVDPKVFADALSNVDFVKADEIFPEFFKPGQPIQKYSASIEREPYGSLTSASNYNTRKHEQANEDGFVDPNVQFRSLFDVEATDVGFSAPDFSGYNAENTGPDGSKASQTKVYPSFTYTGRNADEEEDDAPSSQPPKFKSTYRQNPYERNNYFNQNQQQQNNHYDKPVYNQQQYGNSNNGNRNNGNRNSGNSNDEHSSEETAESPQTSPAKNKGGESPSKNKCKKVMKEVDEEEEFIEYAPEDYDPSTYQSRYKRQAGRGRNRGGGKKRPMTCYVCEDEDGRYAEKCSYDSNSEPGKKGNGNYFHSSSTSFTDNGKPRGGRERQKRDPSRFDTPPTFFKLGEIDVKAETESLPKRIQKRQSEGNRYASDFQEEDEREASRQRPVPNTYRATPNTRHPSVHFEYLPSISIDVGRNGPKDVQSTFQNRIGYDSPRNSERETQNSPRPGGSGFEFDFSIPKEFRQDVGLLDTSNAETRPVNSGRGGNGRGSDGRGSDGRGPDGRDDGTGLDVNAAYGEVFDIGYDDYVRKHFPEAFGSTRESSKENEREPSGGAAPPSRDPPSYRHRTPPQGSRGPGSNNDRYAPSQGNFPHGGQYGGFGPQREYTQNSPNYFPTPTYYSPPEVNPQHLEAAINRFKQKDRKDCAKVQRGDMTCYVCRDPRGMNKEECMYASNSDPRNHQMAYSEASEYSSLQPQHSPSPRQVTAGQGGQESKPVVTATKAPIDYDFDY